mmetsp:Transcript_102375/g.285249  ORF Transcript_102375/g.285249 Transcript_102375/m.285249 type:complete len:253 (+) Transcript_102375:241-999(+)
MLGPGPPLQVLHLALRSGRSRAQFGRGLRLLHHGLVLRLLHGQAIYVRRQAERTRGCDGMLRLAERASGFRTKLGQHESIRSRKEVTRKLPLELVALEPLLGLLHPLQRVVDGVDVLVARRLVVPEPFLMEPVAKAIMRLREGLRLSTVPDCGGALRKRPVGNVLPLLSPLVEDLGLQTFGARPLEVAPGLLPEPRKASTAIGYEALHVLLGRRRPPRRSEHVLCMRNPWPMAWAHVGRRSPASLRDAVEVP